MHRLDYVRTYVLVWASAIFVFMRSQKPHTVWQRSVDTLIINPQTGIGLYDIACRQAHT